MPSAVTVRLRFVPTLVATIVAVATARPEGSVTVPDIVPVACAFSNSGVDSAYSPARMLILEIDCIVEPRWDGVYMKQNHMPLVCPDSWTKCRVGEWPLRVDC